MGGLVSNPEAWSAPFALWGVNKLQYLNHKSS